MGKLKRELTVATIGVLAFVLIALLGFLVRPWWEPALPFQTVIKYGQPPAVGFGLSNYPGTGPGIFVVARAQEVEELASSVLAVNIRDIDHLKDVNEYLIAEQLRQIDYSRYFAILVVYGEGDAGGSDIMVQHVTKIGDQIDVWAQFKPPGRMALNLTVYPYHAVVVPKQGEWGRQFQFVLIKDYRSVAEATHFIP